MTSVVFNHIPQWVCKPLMCCGFMYPQPWTYGYMLPKVICCYGYMGLWPYAMYLLMSKEDVQGRSPRKVSKMHFLGLYIAAIS